MQLGEFEILFVDDGTFLLDAGAMFGIVPKPLWSREVNADEKNRMVLRCNCPVIRTSKETILIDCGLGNKWTEKQRAIYGLQEGPKLIEQLAGHGIAPKDITALAHTHLHLDHAGWNTTLKENGELEPVFVNARQFVERRELEVARDPNELQRGTYLEPNIAPIDRGKGFEIFDEQIEIVPGVTMFRTGGHTVGHCCVRIESGGQKAIFIGEMMPTTAHRRLPWIMAYDLFPLETLEAKRKLLKEAVEDKVLVLMNHDPENYVVRLSEGESGKLEVEPVDAKNGNRH